MSDRLDKDHRLAQTRVVGERMRLFAEDPVIKSWFDDAKAREVGKIIEANACDDDARRGAALQIKAIEALWGFVTRAVAEGRRAADEIDKKSQRTKVS
jgi:hypothetical protein